MKRLQHGLSLVELMVGIAVALFVVATASVAASNQLNENRRLMLETQVEQDLRAAMDLIVRDIRRSGYWQNAALQLGPVGGASNGYTTVSAPDAAHPASSLTYAYSRDETGKEDDIVSSDERTGVKLEDGIVKLLMGNGGWQAITDPNTVTVTNLRIGMDTQSIDLSAYCANPCPALPGPLPCPPVQQLRTVNMEISGTAARAPQIKRSLKATVRLRNDRIVGSCAG